MPNPELRAIIFWSCPVLSGVLTEQIRAMLFMTASFAVIRLEQLTGSEVGRVGKCRIAHAARAQRAPSDRTHAVADAMRQRLIP